MWPGKKKHERFEASEELGPQLLALKMEEGGHESRNSSGSRQPLKNWGCQTPGLQICKVMNVCVGFLAAKVWQFCWAEIEIEYSMEPVI